MAEQHVSLQSNVCDQIAQLASLIQAPQSLTAPPAVDPALFPLSLMRMWLHLSCLVPNTFLGSLVTPPLYDPMQAAF